MSVRTPLAALVAVAALLIAAPAASAAKLVVDDDATECPNRDHSTVQAAVNAAATSGDTVVVCPGVYRASGGVAITKSLTIKGAGADRVRIEPAADLRDPAPPGGVYEPRDDSGNVISVNSPAGAVHISGVTVAGGDASEPRGAEAGIVFHNTSGSVSRSRVTDVVPADTADFSSNVGYGVVVFGDAAGSHSFSLSRTVVERYGKGGVLITNLAGSTSTTGTVEDSVIRGRGPRSEPGQGQNGIQVSGSGASAAIRRNAIVNHRFLADESASAGVLLFDVDPTASAINDNDFLGNGYGVFNAGPDLCDAAAAVPAASNYWGNPAGPTVDLSSGPLSCPPAIYAPTGDPAQGDRVNGAAVAFATPDTTPHGTPLAPGQATDSAPSVNITAPVDGAEVTPGSNVAVTANATDDFDVRRVDFVRNGTTVASDADGPSYSASVAGPAAGGSIAITAVVRDSAGQTGSDVATVQGRRAATTPRSPSAPEDRPPTVAFASPGPGAAIDPRFLPRLRANASDDRGVARVVFLDDGRVVCTDTAAPFDCAYTPTGDDVGRNTLIAIAQDGAGQTAVDFRPVRVAKFTATRITARTTPRRDRRRPYRYRTRGKLTLPPGLTAAQACGSGGTVQVQMAAGRLKLPLIAPLRPDCSFRTSIAFPSRRPLGRRGRLTVTTLFPGNDVLAPARAKKQRVRAG
jgi:hypothetical protein